MSRLKAKIKFYQALLTMLDAGVPIVRALKQHNRSAFSRISRGLAGMIEEQHISFADAAEQYSGVFDAFELKLFRVGEQTGRLPMILKSLIKWHENTVRLRKEVISKMLYPMFLFHMAAIILPILFHIFNKPTMLVTGTCILALSILPYVLFLMYKLMFLICRSVSTGPLSFLRAFPLYIPVFGSLIRKLDYMRFFYIYGLCLEAGLSVPDATYFGASTCKNSYLKELFEKTGNAIAGENSPFYEVFQRFVFGLDSNSVIFPMMETGETSGKGDQTALQVSVHYQEEAEGTIKFLAGFLPKLFYFVMVIFLAIAIVYFMKTLLNKFYTIGGR